MAPCVTLQIPIPALANPVVLAAILKFADSIVLTTESDECVNGRTVAAFDISAQELAALGEAECINGRGFGQDRVDSEVTADFRDLFCYIAEKGCGTIGRRIVIEANEVGIRSRVCGISDFTNRAKPVGFVTNLRSVAGLLKKGPSICILITKAMPDYERQRG